jgi:hypothetical protein
MYANLFVNIIFTYIYIYLNVYASIHSDYINGSNGHREEGSSPAENPFLVQNGSFHEIPNRCIYIYMFIDIYTDTYVYIDVYVNIYE